MKKIICFSLLCVLLSINVSAQRNSGRLLLGTGLLYKNGMEATLAYEHEVNYRHTWEFFANGYLRSNSLLCVTRSRAKSSSTENGFVK